MTDSATTPTDDELFPANQVEPLGTYLRELWHRRDYIIQVPLNELRVEQANTVLGNVWLILNPILSITVYYIVFGILINVRRGIDDYIAFLAIGVFTFMFSQRMITNGAKSVSSSIGLVRAIRFPRAVLPISTAVASVLGFMPNIVVMFVTVMLWGNFPSLRWLVIPLIFALQVLFSTGGSLVVARLNHLYADMENTLPFVFRLTFYLSGVLYAVDKFVANETWQHMFAFNPLYDYLSLWRWALVGQTLDPWVWLGAVVWGLLTPILGFLFFRRGEASYGKAS